MLLFLFFFICIWFEGIQVQTEREYGEKQRSCIQFLKWYLSVCWTKSWCSLLILCKNHKWIKKENLFNSTLSWIFEEGWQAREVNICGYPFYSLILINIIKINIKCSFFFWFVWQVVRLDFKICMIPKPKVMVESHWVCTWVGCVTINLLSRSFLLIVWDIERSG